MAKKFWDYKLFQGKSLFHLLRPPTKPFQKFENSPARAQNTDNQVIPMALTVEVLGFEVPGTAMEQSSRMKLSSLQRMPWRGKEASPKSNENLPHSHRQLDLLLAVSPIENQSWNDQHRYSIVVPARRHQLPERPGEGRTNSMRMKVCGMPSGGCAALRMPFKILSLRNQRATMHHDAYDGTNTLICTNS